MINAEYTSEEYSRFKTVEHQKNLPAIPPEAKPDWSEVFTIEIRENNDRLLPLSLAEGQILVRPAYFSAGIEKALPDCYARDEIRKRLLVANSLLPKGLRLIILDAWRSKETQTALFTACSKALEKAYPDIEADKIVKMTEEFVAPPSLSSERPSPHATGGAVDLTIASVDGVPLHMGAPFDYPGPVSNTRYYEERVEKGERVTDLEQEALLNRRLLYDVMIKAGFVNYHGEWWHFEYGTQRWGFLKGIPHALYGPRIITLNTFEALVPCSSGNDITTLVTAGG
ncbi:M15 family metallopeptidase [Maridesulfovibrio sp.]|uniref:M15 family metallopeptidase n=1 Tax=Maridesulfovibrio sp. TaxID=2795000 RepID=UPI0029C9F469|nr:M15 family metallopeptidase [Maridesulfovibrio sp.]